MQSADRHTGHAALGAGAVGAVTFCHDLYVQPSSIFGPQYSVYMLFMVIIGGLGSILGSFLGAAFILVLPILLDQVPHALGVPISVETVSLLVFIVTGALICWLLIVEPHGFARLWSTAKEKLRLWPYPY